MYREFKAHRFLQFFGCDLTENTRLSIGTPNQSLVKEGRRDSCSNSEIVITCASVVIDRGRRGSHPSVRVGRDGTIDRNCTNHTAADLSRQFQVRDTCKGKRWSSRRQADEQFVFIKLWLCTDEANVSTITLTGTKTGAQRHVANVSCIDTCYYIICIIVERASEGS